MSNVLNAAHLRANSAHWAVSKAYLELMKQAKKTGRNTKNIRISEIEALASYLENKNFACDGSKKTTSSI